MHDNNDMGSFSDCIHALWIGNRLSALELLTIESFLNNKHRFVLWTYEQILTPLPKQVIIKDATQIIPKEDIFQYKNKNQFGHGKGSYAGFSDIFRYKLLYEYGGWWTDMDVTCLKPLDFSAPYVFRTHHDLKVVGNIMKCPPKSELMLRCYDKAIAEVDADNCDWNKPIRILNDTIFELGLQQYIIEISNRDSWNDVRKLIAGKKQVPDHWYIIHWVNEEWRRNKINKDYSGRNSVLRQLYLKNQVSIPQLSLLERVKNGIKLSFFIAAIKYFPSWAWCYVEYYLRKYLKRSR
jgi:hypothetical protein